MTNILTKRVIYFLKFQQKQNKIDCFYVLLRKLLKIFKLLKEVKKSFGKQIIRSVYFLIISFNFIFTQFDYPFP